MALDDGSRECPKLCSPGSILEPKLLLIFINDLENGMCNPCYPFAGDFGVTGVDLEEDIRKSPTGQLSGAFHFARPCQRLTSGTGRRGNEMGDIADASAVTYRGGLIAINLKPPRM